MAADSGFRGIIAKRIPVFSQSITNCRNFKTEIAQRLSVVLSLTAAYFIFQEQFNSLKIVGIALGIAAVLCILYSHRGGASSAQAGMLYLALVWVGYALIDVLLKYTTGLGLQFALVLNLMFICAFILSLGYILIQHKSWGSGKI